MENCDALYFELLDLEKRLKNKRKNTPAKDYKKKDIYYEMIEDVKIQRINLCEKPNDNKNCEEDYEKRITAYNH